LPRIDEIALTQGTAVFGLLVALLAGVVFALLPMLATNNASIQGVLRGGSSSSTGPRGARRLQDLLVANQAALALTLLVGAGLLVQSARNLAATEPGFRTDGALTFEIGLPEEEYAGRNARPCVAGHRRPDRTDRRGGGRGCRGVPSLLPGLP